MSTPLERRPSPAVDADQMDPAHAVSAAEEPPSAMAQAADAALASALAKLGVEEELKMSMQPTVVPEIQGFKVADDDVPRVPSVVTFGGQPVAVDGDLVYLGGGLYAAAAPPATKEPSSAARKPKLMPGRIRPGPRAGVSQAKLLGSRSASARALQSNSDVGLGFPLSRSNSEGPGAASFSDTNSEKAQSSSAPKAWRPAGPAKIPHQLAETSHHTARTLARADEIGDGGCYSETRAAERAQARREGGGLFGAKGLLGEIARMQEPAPPSVQRAGVVGAPSNSDVRAAERKAVKEARVEQILADRQERIAAEALFRQPRSLSAPSIPRATKEDLDRQKLRVACKMEMLDFFNGYSKNVNKMTADQTKALLHKLHGGLEVANVAYPPIATHEYALSGQPSPSTGQGFDGSPDAECVATGRAISDTAKQDPDVGETLFADWPDEVEQGDNQSIHGRLQQVNDFCNKAFDTTFLEEVGF
jgi:hypothetical protein